MFIPYLKVYCPICNTLVDDLYKNTSRPPTENRIINTTCKNGHEFFYESVQSMGVAKTGVLEYSYNQR